MTTVLTRNTNIFNWLTYSVNSVLLEQTSKQLLNNAMSPPTLQGMFYLYKTDL